MYNLQLLAKECANKKLSAANGKRLSTFTPVLFWLLFPTLKFHCVLTNHLKQDSSWCPPDARISAHTLTFCDVLSHVCFLTELCIFRRWQKICSLVETLSCVLINTFILLHTSTHHRYVLLLFAWHWPLRKNCATDAFWSLLKPFPGNGYPVSSIFKGFNVKWMI